MHRKQHRGEQPEKPVAECGIDEEEDEDGDEAVKQEVLEMVPERLAAPEMVVEHEGEDGERPVIGTPTASGVRRIGRREDGRNLGHIAQESASTQYDRLVVPHEAGRQAIAVDQRDRGQDDQHGDASSHPFDAAREATVSATDR